ncbi:MAG: hypothetical protein NVS9B7_29070 [Flavisolibacter sp.]
MQDSRRRFIKTSLETALLLTSLKAMAFKKPSLDMNKNFELKLLATNWGFGGTLDDFCAKVKKEGYDGIEIWWPMEQEAKEALFQTLKKYSLEVGFLCGAQQGAYSEHLENFKKMVDAAAHTTLQKPLYINCHSGRDFFSYDQNQSFIDHTTQLSKKTGVLICHETHRSRLLFAAPMARTYIEKNPELQITLDISHWCTVSESLLSDQQNNVHLALERVGHIHARVGHPEGPQVNDPRAPEWKQAVEAHFSWWDQVVERKKRNGERLTILTEFGPPDYMPTMPYSRKPLSDQWAINVYMMETLRKRYLS